MHQTDTASSLAWTEKKLGNTGSLLAYPPIFSWGAEATSLTINWARVA